MASLAVQGLAKSFGDTTVLRDVDLVAESGEFLTLLGPSGCGKSTLLRIIAGLERQDSGHVFLDGDAIDTQRPARRDMAMVFQSYALYPHMSVRKNIATPLEMRGLNPVGRMPGVGRLVPGATVTRRAIDEKVRQVADALEISALLDRKPSQLSGGQRQRVALARAMVREPRIFLMDEPLSNLDAKLRVQMRSEIRALNKRLGRTFIFVTHDQTEAMTMSDRIAVMMGGRIGQFDTPRALYDRPATLDVARFIGTLPINEFSATAATGHLTATALTRALPAVQASIGSPLTVAIRPDAFRMVEKDRALIVGRVHTLETLGGEIVLYLAVAGHEGDVRVQLHHTDARHLSVGDDIALGVEAEDVHAFDANARRLAFQSTPLEIAV